ncbi:MAG: hypothetical protein QOD39_1566, partial [Mycobacterium sp.]|nr:hypothetical protein [Mycobacterium sp.]
MVASETLPQLSFRSSSCLMEDAISAGAISVQEGGQNGIALYSNPYLDGKEEALAINTDGHLTHLRRADLQLGWDQVEIVDTQNAKISATEVVVVVSPRDLSLWAVYIGADQKLRVLTLPRPVGGATSTWTAQPAPSAFSDPEQPHRLYVQYWGNVPCISLLDASNGFYYRIMAAQTSSGAVPMGITFAPVGGPAGPVDGFAAGLPRTPQRVPGIYWSHTTYSLTGNTLTRQDGDVDKIGTISTEVSTLVGVFQSGQSDELGCLYLNTEGDLCASYYITGEHTGLVTVTCPGLALHTATVWADANGMLHVYGTDMDNALKVVHQTGWLDAGSSKPGGPVWTQAVKDGTSVVVCVAVKPSVVSFAIDPYPDYQPNQMIKSEGVKADEGQYSICTQDITTTRWTTEPIRKRPENNPAPSLVTHYVSEITLTNVSGAPVPGRQVSVTADSLVEIISGGASYLVGPGHSAVLSVNAMGRVSIAIAANSLNPPTLQVSAVGAQGGLTIQPAADVHNYLGGEGTLASQTGRFSTDAVMKAKITKADRTAVDYTVSRVQQVFGQAKGKALTSHLLTGDGPPKEIHGFSMVKDEQGKIHYHEFDTPEQAAKHMESIRALPNYGGIWEDFLDFASDVWEGIRTGVIEVVSATVEVVTTICIKIAGKIFELVNFVIDTVQSAVHAAESLFRLVVTAIDKVVDWLKALFDFHDIWDTKQALESGM